MGLVLAAVLWFGLRIVGGVDPPVITTTSTAMKPTVRPGDLVLLHEADPDDLAVGDVVAHREDGDIKISRVIAVPSGFGGTFALRGDNREDNEPTDADADSVIGTTGARLPLLGWLLVLVRSTAGQLFIAAVCFFGFAAAFRARYREHGALEEAAAVTPARPAVSYGGADMSITPAELRHVRFAQVRRGYDTEAVDRALESVADSIEDLLHERHELIERVRHLEGEIERYRELEGTLSETLGLAERAAEELKAEAQAEADRLLGEARSQLAAAQQAAAKAAEAGAAAEAAAPMAAAGGSALPDPAFIELLGETRAIRSLLQALLTTSPPGGEGGSPFTPRQ